MEGLNIESLDVQDTEILNEPAAEPTPPVVEETTRARDPATGQFVSQAAPEPAPAPAAPQEPVVAPTTTVAPPATPEPPKVIPLASHLEERRRYQQEIADRDQRLKDIHERLSKLEPQQKDPDFIEDPKGYVDTQAQKALKEIESLKQEAAQLRERQQLEHFVGSVQNHEAAFVEKTTDYYDAIKYVRGIRQRQLAYLRPDFTEDQINQAVAQEELQTAYGFMQVGKNPAEAAYAMAETFGYKKPVAPTPELKTEPKPKVEVPKVPVGDPGSTLGPGSGGDGETDELVEEDATPEAVLAEVFGRRGFKVR